MNKKRELDKVAKEIDNCRVCKNKKSGRAVPGEGNPDADIVFLGEAPGRKEAQTGRPFVGRSGMYLRSLIKKIGLKENDVFITSPVKYLPDYGTPTIVDILHGKTHLDKQLAILNPKIIVTLGKVGAFALLGKSTPILKEHGKILKLNNRKIFLTLHPAAALRFPRLKKLIVEDFLKLKKILRE